MLERIVKSMFREQAGKGTTVFMSTHSLETAEAICDEIAIIQSGRIIASGSAGTLRDQSGVDGDLEQIFLKLTEDKRPAHERPLSAH